MAAERGEVCPRTGSFGSPPWADHGSAQVGIHKALARSGIHSEFLPSDAGQNVLAAADRLEAAMDRGEAPIRAFDEAGMLLVDTAQADVGVNFREQVDWAHRGIAHQQ